MSNKMPFEMRKLTSFPMEKLCYNLKLEMFEQMEPNDAIELVKVNAGFRSILLRKPWIVFGCHVHEIYAHDDKIQIEKISVQTDADLHFPLIERIHSCDALSIFLDERFIDGHWTILNQLKSVKCMWLYVDGNEYLQKFFENFRALIEFKVFINFQGQFRGNINRNNLFKENQVSRELFENFITNQVNDCEYVSLAYQSWPSLDLYYNAFAKTSIKCLNISLDGDHLEAIAQSIVKNGIPSKNLKATVRVTTWISLEMNSRIIDFLSQFPGMKRFDGENQPEIMKMATEHLKKYLEEGVELDFTRTLFFRRNIDSSRDCVYMLTGFPDVTDIWTEFFVFYVQLQSEMMLF